MYYRGFWVFLYNEHMSVEVCSLPKVSFIIPVLNAAELLPECLSSIYEQDYPHNLIEIVVADGGSTDNSVGIAGKSGASVFENPLKTSESGKAVGVKNATGEFVIFVDSDNLLPSRDWLKKMIKPLLLDKTLIGSEPLEFTYRKQDGYIDRYCALLGMNDPLCLWLGSYDRMNTLTGKWTGLPVRSVKKPGFLELTLESGKIPTIGANGAVFRRWVFTEDPNLYEKYLFDMDVLEQLVADRGPQKFAKINIGIVHLYCGSNMRKFAKKQLRRVSDFLYRRSVKDVFISQKFEKRKYKYGQSSSLMLLSAILKFSLSCVFVVPLFWQVARGYRKKPDVAWLYHIPLCFITLGAYVWGVFRSLFHSSELSRENW